MGYWRFYPRYVTVAEKRAKAERKLKQLRKKNPGIKPIIVEGSAIVKTWWGKSWNRNLEKYADYSNRIGRGRSYVRHGAVLDLRIDSGRVDALVQGTRSKPYSVSIKIKTLTKKIQQDIKTACEGQLDSLQELLAGKFPKALGEVFTAQGKGLFPSPKEIDFSCSCPDWAYMCKHVAATLYAIGTRLDEEPELFFKLRRVKMKDLVTQAVADTSRKLIKKAEKEAPRTIAESDLADVFGIDMEAPAAPYKKKAKAAKKVPKAKKPLKRAPKKTKAKPATRKTKTKTAPKKAAPKRKPKPPYDTVVAIVRRSKKGVTCAIIKDKTGFDEQRIWNFIYKAKKQGKIKNLKRGLYISA